MLSRFLFARCAAGLLVLMVFSCRTGHVYELDSHYSRFFKRGEDPRIILYDPTDENFTDPQEAPMRRLPSVSYPYQEGSYRRYDYAILVEFVIDKRGRARQFMIDYKDRERPTNKPLADSLDYAAIELIKNQRFLVGKDWSGHKISCQTQMIVEFQNTPRKKLTGKEKLHGIVWYKKPHGGM